MMTWTQLGRNSVYGSGRVGDIASIEYTAAVDGFNGLSGWGGKLHLVGSAVECAAFAVTAVGTTANLLKVQVKLTHEESLKLAANTLYVFEIVYGHPLGEASLFSGRLRTDP